jgi:hypothetical protein
MCSKGKVVLMLDRASCGEHIFAGGGGGLVDCGSMAPHIRSVIKR